MATTISPARCCLCSIPFTSSEPDPQVWVDGRFGGQAVIHYVCDPCKTRPDVEQLLLEHGNQQQDGHN